MAEGRRGGTSGGPGRSGVGSASRGNPGGPNDSGRNDSHRDFNRRQAQRYSSNRSTSRGQRMAKERAARKNREKALQRHKQTIQNDLALQAQIKDANAAALRRQTQQNISQHPSLSAPANIAETRAGFREHATSPDTLKELALGLAPGAIGGKVVRGIGKALTPGAKVVSYAAKPATGISTKGRVAGKGTRTKKSPEAVTESLKQGGKVAGATVGGTAVGTGAYQTGKTLAKKLSTPAKITGGGGTLISRLDAAEAAGKAEAPSKPESPPSQRSPNPGGSADEGYQRGGRGYVGGAGGPAVRSPGGRTSPNEGYFTPQPSRGGIPSDGVNVNLTQPPKPKVVQPPAGRAVIAPKKKIIKPLQAAQRNPIAAGNPAHRPNFVNPTTTRKASQRRRRYTII